VKKINRVQRLARKEESAIIKRIVWLTVLSVVIIILVFTVGIPLLGGFADLLGKLLGGKNPVGVVDEGGLSAPIIENLPHATNSASLVVFGFANDGKNVEVYLNSEKVGEAEVIDDKFKYEGLNLKSGENEITAKSIDSSGNTSNSSQNSKVILDTIKPEIAIVIPSDGQSFSGINKAKVEGSSEKDAEILVNGFLANVDNDGKFEVTIPLSEGENVVEAKATDAAGNTSTVLLKVNFHP